MVFPPDLLPRFNLGACRSYMQMPGQCPSQPAFASIPLRIFATLASHPLSPTRPSPSALNNSTPSPFFQQFPRFRETDPAPAHFPRNILAPIHVFLNVATKENPTHMRSKYPQRILNLAAPLMFAIPFVAIAVPAAHAQAQSSQDKPSDNDNISASFNLGKDASAKDVGLPPGPGSHRPQDSKDDSASLNMGLSGGSSGFKMAMLKMDSTDSPDKIAAFYRKALSKYGRVLTCSGPGAASAKDSSADAKSSNLSCDNDKPDKDDIELKAGTKQNQHVVGIKPEGAVTTYQLVYVETHGLDDDKK